jgi:S1-C subfamily serine protease
VPRGFRTSFVAALAGGAVVAVAMLVLGVGDSTSTRTVVEQAALGGSTNSSSTAAAHGLTPHDIYERVAPGVVFVRSTIVQDVPSPFGLAPSSQRSEATGSGFVVDREGRILTNYHVVAGASSVEVAFAGDSAARATIVGTDPSNDLAVLRVDPAHVTLSPLSLGDSDSVRVGDPALAIGNPFGLDRTLTSGIVSALQREIRAPDGFTIDHVIQTDAAINPGNSGGPLLDAAGRVIGINSQIATGETGSQGNVGIGFAVPIDTARAELPQLEANGSVARGFMGIDGLTVTPSLAKAVGLPVDHGVLVQSVQAGSPAARAGLHGGSRQAQLAGQSVAMGGDVITAIDGRPVESIEGLVNRVADHRPGDVVKVAYRVPGSWAAHTCTVTLAKRPTGSSTN